MRSFKNKAEGGGKTAQREDKDMERSEEIRAILGISRVAFSRKYNIPLRTLEDWDAGKKNPPDYVLNMLERVVNEDKDKEGEDMNEL